MAFRQDTRNVHYVACSAPKCGAENAADLGKIVWIENGEHSRVNGGNPRENRESGENGENSCDFGEKYSYYSMPSHGSSPRIRLLGKEDGGVG